MSLAASDDRLARLLAALAVSDDQLSRLLAWDFRKDSSDGFGLDEVRLGFSVLTSASALHGMGLFFDVSGVDGNPKTTCCTRLAYPVTIRRL